MQVNQLLIDLFQAYFVARKNKRNTINALAFELHYERELFSLYDEIIHRKYTIKPSIAFIVNRPVKREVFAANFRDRVVHHLIYNYINPIFEKTFIHDSYSCRKKKGTLFGIKRLEHFIRSCSENYTKPCWILKLDIQGYFMSMSRSLLFDKITSHMQDKRHCLQDYPGQYDILIYLLEKVVFNEPTTHFILKGKKSDWKDLPFSKSLFHSLPGQGFPIGNLTSQLFSNIYLNDFDHYVKKSLGFKYYGRYVDDFVLIHRDKSRLQQSIPYIDQYLKQELGLILHPRKRYLQPGSHGVQFLGSVIKPWRKYLINRTKGSFHHKLDTWLENSTPSDYPLTLEELREIEATTNSYLGDARHFSSFKLRRRCIQRISRNLVYFSYINNYRKINILNKFKIEMKDVFLPPAAHRLRYARYRAQAPA